VTRYHTIIQIRREKPFYLSSHRLFEVTVEGGGSDQQEIVLRFYRDFSSKFGSTVKLPIFTFVVLNDQERDHLIFSGWEVK